MINIFDSFSIFKNIVDGRAERDRVYVVARRDMARDEYNSLRNNERRRDLQAERVRHEINNAQFRLAERQRLDALRRNERTEMDRQLIRLSGDRRRIETVREREVDVERRIRNVRLEDERTVDTTERMERHRRIRTDKGRAQQEHRLERIERNSIRRENNERSDRRQRFTTETESADRRETERLERKSFRSERQNINQIRRSRSDSERRELNNVDRMERENQESRHMEKRNERRETERFNRMETRRNDQRREARDILAHISRQQNILGADAVMTAEKSQLISSKLAWPLLELVILGAIIAHIIKKDDTIKPKK